MKRFAIFVSVFVLAASLAYASCGPGAGIGWIPGNHISHVSITISQYDGALDGYDAGDSYSTSWGDSSDNLLAACRRDTGVSGWDGPSGWYYYFAVPFPAPGESTVIKDIYVWAGQSYAHDTFNIGYMGPGFANPQEWKRTLRLVKVPDSIVYNGPTEWDIPLSVTKVGAAMLPDASLPAYKTDDPLSGYQFEIEIQHLAVPEPSSMLALLAGVGGIGGLVWRRRKR